MCHQIDFLDLEGLYVISYMYLDKIKHLKVCHSTVTSTVHVCLTL